MLTEKDYTDIWNELHCKCVKENEALGNTGADSSLYRNNIMADHCEEMILKAKDAYYNSGDVIMSDWQYDMFEDRLRVLRPNSIILNKVGS